ncbi:MAG TPA: hypothetical protein ENN51_07290 [candidate division WOR-3 bacterium]|uniref:Uncharacterized protein n=1 Tax=candidate division WOR-3 bacterium TaxID=2052148 RepID=A0A7V0T6I4_UNCW3|nr:hypothetical protein [candidate division WOR-3 bacterium]
MKQALPRLLCLVAGVVMIVQFFVPHGVSETLFSESLRWVRIISAFALILGVRSIIAHHGTRVRRRTAGWVYSAVTLTAMVVSTFIGLFVGKDANTPSLLASGAQTPIPLHMQLLYENIMAPLGATMFSILAFYMASAAYRAFRARNKEATLLLVAAFIVMIGMVPIGAAIWTKFPDVAQWLLNVPNMAAKRGIWFGIALGMIATSLKIILGIERGWLGGGRG